MGRKGGIEEAAKMLAGLDLKSRENVLSIISKQNPKMAELLKRNMVTFEDLKFMTVKMLQEFLREIDLNDLGMALRIGTKELRDFFLDNVSKSMASELLYLLNGPPQPVSKVEEKVEGIMEIVRKKIDKGEIILDKEGSEQYV